MTKLEWERLDDSGGAYSYRAKVIGGWLVQITHTAWRELEGRQSEETAASALTFVPDPNYEWA